MAHDRELVARVRSEVRTLVLCELIHANRQTPAFGGGLAGGAGVVVVGPAAALALTRPRQDAGLAVDDRLAPGCCKAEVAP